LNIDNKSAVLMIRTEMARRGLRICVLAELIHVSLPTARRVVTQPITCLATVRRFEIAIGAPIVSPALAWQNHHAAARKLGTDPLLLTRKELIKWLKAHKVPIGRDRSKERLIERILEHSTEEIPTQ